MNKKRTINTDEHKVNEMTQSHDVQGVSNIFVQFDENHFCLRYKRYEGGWR